MRNPNGYGSVVKLSGKRRKPFAVRKTRGFDDRGYPNYEFIGFYETQEEANIRLAEYNKTPWDVKNEKLTFSELYDLWLEKKSPKLGKGNVNCLKSAYKHCKSLYFDKYTNIKAYHMQEIIDNCGHGYSTQSAIKNLFNHLDKFALELDIVAKCYSTLLTSDPIPQTKKQPFTAVEVERLWEISECPWVDTVLIFLYSGFRISELLNMKKSDVNLENLTFTGGVKTKAGKNRIVPIHSKIQPLVENLMQKDGDFLFGYGVSAFTYYQKWREIMGKIGAKHTVHETRHTFRSWLDSATANKKCIDLLMGHTSRDVGERVYTHKTVEELRETVELIK